MGFIAVSDPFFGIETAEMHFFWRKKNWNSCLASLLKLSQYDQSWSSLTKSHCAGVWRREKGKDKHLQSGNSSTEAYHANMNALNMF